MRKKSALICLVALLAIPGIALAAAVKVQLAPWAPNGPIEPDASGKANLNYAKGADKTIVQVNCWALMPEAEYTVYLSPDFPAEWNMIGTFTTDAEGEGHLHVFLPGDQSHPEAVAVNNAANSTVLLGGE